jgi:hypothetical protein
MHNVQLDSILLRNRVNIDGFGLVIGFIDVLEIVTTSKYRANAKSTACTKSSQSAIPSPVVVWQRLPTP